MYPSLVLSAALIAPAAPVPRDTVPSTPGPAPRVLALKADPTGTVRIYGNQPVKVTVTNTHFVLENINENGKIVQRQVQKQVEQDVVTTQYINKTLADLNGKFTTAEGTALTLDEATNRVKNGATVLASSDGKPIAKAWLRAVAPDTVVVIADGLSHVQPQWGSGGTMPTTPAPRLAMLGTDESGKLMTACTSAPLNTNGTIYYDDLMLEGRAFRGGRMMRGDIDYSYGLPQNVGKVILKPLADVKFDAYDLSGKLIPRTEVMKRLAAGGMVLVAGDSHMPDETYTKAFREDVLVLVSPELVLPVTPIDQTTKKKEPEKAPVVPAAPALQPLAPIAPAVPVKPAIIKGRAAVAPVQVEKIQAEKIEKEPIKK